jgi:uncharacterized protein (DUF305 family)
MKLRSTLLFSLILFTAACGSSHNMDSMDKSESETASYGSSADFNDEDVHFLQMMIPHHEQAIEMSDIALDPTIGASDAVKGLATQIKGAQDPEITQMNQWLTDLGKTEMDSSMDMTGEMDGMLTADQLMNLGTLRGAEFDNAWIKAMIGHHEGAIEMATVVIADGSNSQVRVLAEAIIIGQQKEIGTLKALLG